MADLLPTIRYFENRRGEGPGDEVDGTLARIARQQQPVDSQLLMVRVKPSDHSCQFLFVGPPATNSLFILKEGCHFHGLKDPIIFFLKNTAFFTAVAR